MKELDEQEYGIDKANEIFERNSNAYDEHMYKQAEDSVDWYESAKKQPNHFSWLTVDANTHVLATDSQNGIKYRDTKDMKEQFLSWLIMMLSDDLLELVRSGKIRNLTFRIGPEALDSRDINEDAGIDLSECYN